MNRWALGAAPLPRFANHMHEIKIRGTFLAGKKWYPSQLSFFKREPSNRFTHNWNRYHRCPGGAPVHKGRVRYGHDRPERGRQRQYFGFQPPHIKAVFSPFGAFRFHPACIRFFFGKIERMLFGIPAIRLHFAGDISQFINGF